MPPCIVAAVDTAAAGDALAGVAETDEVTDGAKPGAEPACGTLAAVALDDVLTTGGVAADDAVADAEPCRKQSKANEFFAKKAESAEIAQTFSSYFGCSDR